jgi:hydrogenase maturation protease
LVAGIGNVLLGDDGFGVEVVGRLDPATMPEGVHVADYGIAGVHLAYDVLDGGYESLIMVDAVSLNEPPGTLAIMQVHPDGPTPDVGAAPAIDAHSLNPETVLATVKFLGAGLREAHVVGCQPSSVDEGIGLSAAVAAAVDEAVNLVRALAARQAGVPTDA